MTVWFGRSSTRRLAIAAMLLLFAVGSWHASSVVAKASNGQTVRAVTASTSRPYCLKGQQLKGNKKRGFKCWFRKHRGWWEGVECQAHYERKYVYRHRHYTGDRCVPTPHTSASPPLSVFGSISNVHAVSATGNTISATFTISTSGCSAGSCLTYAHAFFVHVPETCAYGDGTHKWIFRAVYSHYVPYKEMGSATFKRLPGDIRICLYVHVHTATSEPQTLAAESIVNAAGSSLRSVPLTVNNICSLNPGLGVRYPFKGSAGPGVYWDNNKNGVVDFAAFSYEGDNAVDAVFVNDRRGVLTWVAHCYPRETAWLNYPQYVREHSQSAPQPQQPASSQQLQSGPQPLTPSSQLALFNFIQNGQGDALIVGPPSVGTSYPNNGTQGCGPSDINSICVVGSDGIPYGTN